MKQIQFIEGAFFNDIVLDLESAISSGEIIKISAHELTEKPTEKLLFIPFEISSQGIKPVIVTINDISQNEIYNKAVQWADLYYNVKNQIDITKVPNKNMTIHDFALNIKFSRIMGQVLFVDMPYFYTIDFSDGEITMSFRLGDENGEANKISLIFIAEAEKMINDLSYFMVDYIMK
ncbi:DUF4468 domain-containing protein [Namhaeicola litoreus]|uniref:DUF4468 domain-containing protein n=1 Tax=Namhaeicola litoreus TaxID=1052145 RepID=A0ABW3Y6I5_9FLAO